MFSSVLSAALVCLVALTELGNAASDSPTNPVVKLPYGTVQGVVQNGITQFLGIPFAAPPTGKRRFGLPEPPIPFTGIRNASEFGALCSQQAVEFPPNFPLPTGYPPRNASEDCLFINIFRPANTSLQNLPVLFYFYGGGFEVGDSSFYPGTTMVGRSLLLENPVIYVSANYRLNAFGFLGGKEVKEKGLGNIGLRDQRFALEWVQKNIAAFGGDRKKVTIWGESAGAISVGLHMLFNGGNTDGLFSAAIMESGSPFRAPDILDHQHYFDDLVAATNCTDASDRFECVRDAPYEAIKGAVDASPSMFSYKSMALAWRPVIDGCLIPRNPMKLVESGKYAKIPFITGDTEDEGTLFAQFSLNVTTNDQFVEYIKTNYLPYITDEQMQALASAYPDDITQGSPFGTGTANAKTPEYKRISALQGDMFQGPRRFLLEVASKTQPTYSFRYNRDATRYPDYGVWHSSELPYFFGFLPNQTDYIATDAIIYFARTHNPNHEGLYWPKWNDLTSGALLTFVDGSPGVNITLDDYRREPIKYLNSLLKM